VPEGLYAAAAGLAAQQARLDSVANDIANASTPGYRKDRMAFRDLVSNGVEAGVAATELGRSETAGSLEGSDNPLALAIEGPGFFQVRGADGKTLLTRAGEFQLDARRHVVTSSGNDLVPPVVIPAGVTVDHVQVARDGTITAGATRLGKLAIVDVPAVGGLQPMGAGTYAPTAASGAPAAVAKPAISQGFLEGSNVDMADSMVDMLDAQRSFELASRAVRMQDQLMDIANQIRR
jgi:flagellar basal-body rod protein FlgG